MSSQVVANPKYRADPARSIEVFGELTEQLAENLVSKIIGLRQGKRGSDPITVYINSRGGLVRALDIIHGALISRDQDNRRIRIITVSVGNSASAAANLLAFGNYAIAHKYSSIHFHGVRANEIELTAEDAVGIAKQFAVQNRNTANELASRIIGRVAHRYSTLRPDAKKALQRAKAKKQNKTELGCFCACLKEKTGWRAQQLIDNSHHGVLLMYKLIGGVFGKIKTLKSLPALKQDIRVIKALLEHEYEEHKDQGWRIDESGIEEMMSDYLAMREYLFGDHVTLINDSIKTWGAAFLSESEFKRMEKYNNSKDKDAATRLLLTKAKPLAEPCFFFVLNLCRNLLKGENRLSAADAYWLGIVDEVAGTGLKGSREFFEPPYEEPATTPSPAPTASSPHSPTVPLP